MNFTTIFTKVIHNTYNIIYNPSHPTQPKTQPKMFEFLLGKSGLTIQQFQSQFKDFIVDNRLVGTAAGVTIGVTTKELIQSFVGDIVIPFFYVIAFQFGIEKIELLPGKTAFDFTSFFRQVITWILSVIAIFFFIYYFFMSIIGINNQNTKIDTISQSTPPPTSSNQSIAPTTPINQKNVKTTTTTPSTNYSSSSYGNTNSYNNVMST